VHENKDIPKGLLRKIVREDLEMSLEESFKVIFKVQRKIIDTSLNRSISDLAIAPSKFLASLRTSDVPRTNIE